jgi:hypothetical protein
LSRKPAPTENRRRETDRIGQSYANVDTETAERELAAAVANARKSTRAARTRKRR